MSAPDPDATARAFARCFHGNDGETVLAHLRRLTFERHLGPEASEAQLRHLDGQRALVALIANLIARGRDGAALTSDPTEQGAET